MMPDFLQKATEFCANVGKMKDPTDVIAALEVVSRRRGLRPFSCWMMPESAGNYSYTPNENIFYNPLHPRLLTPGKQAEYTSELKFLGERYGGSPLTDFNRRQAYPFTMVEALRILKPTGAQDWWWTFLRSYGARDGVWCPAGNWRFFFAAPKPFQPELGPVVRGVLYQVSGAAAARLTELVRRPSGRSRPVLSERELEVLRLMSHGKTQNEIAATLAVTRAGVTYHIGRIFEKLDAANAAEVVGEAYRLRILRLPDLPN